MCVVVEFETPVVGFQPPLLLNFNPLWLNFKPLALFFYYFLFILLLSILLLPCEQQDLHSTEHEKYVCFKSELALLCIEDKDKNYEVVLGALLLADFHGNPGFRLL